MGPTMHSKDILHKATGHYGTNAELYCREGGLQLVDNMLLSLSVLNKIHTFLGFVIKFKYNLNTCFFPLIKSFSYKKFNLS